VRRERNLAPVARTARCSSRAVERLTGAHAGRVVGAGGARQRTMSAERLKREVDAAGGVPGHLSATLHVLRQCLAYVTTYRVGFGVSGCASNRTAAGGRMT
jgi:hypothetical protein